MTFGEKLKTLRKNNLITQAELAKYLNVDRSTVGKWENNSSTPDFQKLLKIASYFDVKTDFLLGNYAIEKENETAKKFRKIISDLTNEEEAKIIEYAKFLKSQR